MPHQASLWLWPICCLRGEPVAAIYKVTCLGCDFTQEILAGFPCFGYRLMVPPDVHLWTRMAWCGHCRQMVHAEHLLSQAEAEERIIGVSNLRIRQDSERYRQLLVSRQSPPRCLQCGGSSIVPASGTGSDHQLPHPVCGSALVFRHVGFARHSDETRVFSHEGEYLETVGEMLLPGRGYGPNKTPQSSG